MVLRISLHNTNLKSPKEKAKSKFERVMSIKGSRMEETRILHYSTIKKGKF